MRTAHLVGNVFSLSQTFIVNQITGLIDRGTQPDLYTRFEHRASDVHEDVSAYHLDRRSCSANIPSNFFLRLLTAVPIILLNVCRHPVYVMRSLNGWKYGIQAWGTNLLYWTACILNENDGPAEYDVVHCHFGHRGNIGVFLRDIGVIQGKIVTTFYGRDVSEFPETFGSNFYDDLFQNGDAFLVLSNHMKQTLMQLGAPEDRIRVHHLGIDTNRFSPSGHEDASNDPCHLLSIGRFVEKKGFPYALRAVKMLNERPEVPEFHYTLAGDGPRRTELERIIEEEQLNNVRLPGWKNRSGVLDLYDRADVFVAPSVTSRDGDQEGTPTVICEAMSMALPVVATRHAGIPEQVNDRETGLLVDERDSRALADCLAKMITNPALRTKMGQKGRQRATTMFNIDHQVDQLLTMYESIQ